VGSALARNPQLVVVPCHRVVKSDGHIGEYAGGRATKRQLLEQEGIIFAGDYVASFVPFEINT
jgi:methylated-DNA-[protein]-cysteine S-methyltransferase